MTLLRNLAGTSGLTATLAAIVTFSTPALADQVFLDDVIVDGSLCVGFDCVNGESFGFDTIRLKENNLRIKFQDTSNAASFPSVDWSIVANDSVNGGSNYLAFQNNDNNSLPFRVFDDARNNALVVDSQSDVGIGTGNPVTDLHIVTGDTPTVRLDQDGSSGFAPQIWDVAGNETSFFIRDVSNGSTLPFRIRPGVPTSAIDIAASGNVGLSTSSPEQALHVKRSGSTDSFALIESASGDAGFLLEQAGATPAIWEVRNQAGSGRLNVGIAGGNTPLKIDDEADNNLLRLGLNGQPGVVEVTGELRVNSTALNVPDYVFADDYALRPLAEVQVFIDQNSHLPDVPSEADFKANGVNMTEMQMVLLKKVEELTLYTLEQEAVISELKQKAAQGDVQAAMIAALQDRLETLESTR